jgi:hypothetical protein
MAQVVAGAVSVAATTVAGWSGQCGCEAVSAVRAVLLRRDSTPSFRVEVFEII